MGVKINTRHVVIPAEPIRQGIHPLSELDQVDMISHTSVLYFYNRPSHESWVDQSNKKVIDTLKVSLGRALVSFYPLGGRLSWVRGGRFKLECKSGVMGAELIEAKSSNKISDFGSFVDSSRSMFRDLLAHLDYENTPIKELPLLSVQVTKLACGGICLGIQASHVVADGRCAFHFLKEWARLARGERLEVAPFLDRLALKPTTTFVGPQVNIDHVANLYSTDSVQEQTTEMLPSMIVMMRADQIERLKKVANRDYKPETHCRPYTRFEVITGHVWRCMTMARELVTDEMTSLYVVADGRSRLEPPLPSSYFGNAAVPVRSSSQVGDLTSKPLSYACSKVREAIQQLTNDYIRATIKFYEDEESLSNHQFFEDRGDMVGFTKPSSDIWVTSWLNLLDQNIDFGWGSEIYAGPPTGLVDDKNILILPHYPKDGSVKLVIGSHYEDKFSKIFNCHED